MKRKILGVAILCIGATTLFSSCESRSRKLGKGDGASPVTGWYYNDSRYGGYDVVENYHGMITPTGMILVQGGRFTMGANDDEMPTLEANNSRRTVSVSSFYMDETEIANVSYREYLYWLGRAYSNDLPEIVSAALPDSTVWRTPLGYNEPYVQNYLRHAAYNNYPVVGVNWYQASDFCKWRTDRVNEIILIKEGALKPNWNQTGEDVFTTETYMNGQYQGTLGDKKNLKRDLDKNGAGTRSYQLADGIFMPSYRLPTEAEWEYAALGIVGNNPAPETKRRRGEEVFTDRNTLPWGPRNTARYDIHNMYQGEIMGNFMRGKGDVMGVAGALNDNADITAPVRSYQPNAWGLYNMAGNVNEWVMDTYRPSSHDEVAEFRPGRTSDYMRPQFQEDGNVEERDSTGHVPTQRVTNAELAANGRYGPRTANLLNYKDGDTSYTSAALNYGFYKYGENSLVNDSTKVYKGGSWADRSYWLSPGTRRFMQGNLASNTIGFRCVVDRLGSPSGNNEPAGNHFGKEKNHKR